MYGYVKRIRAALTTVELEVTGKTTAPNWKIVIREIEEIEFQLKKLKADAQEMTNEL